MFMHSMIVRICTLCKSVFFNKNMITNVDHTECIKSDKLIYYVNTTKCKLCGKLIYSATHMKKHNKICGVTHLSSTIISLGQLT